MLVCILGLLFGILHGLRMVFNPFKRIIQICPDLNMNIKEAYLSFLSHIFA